MGEPIGFAVREFDPQTDLGPVRRLVVRTLDACYPPFYCAEAIDFFKDFHREEKILREAAEGRTIVLESGGKIAGTGTYVGGRIFRVFVAPELQGRGLGKEIMRVLEETAAKRGVTSIELDASLPSKEFYDSLGYHTVRETHYDVANGKRLDYYIMDRDLSPPS